MKILNRDSIKSSGLEDAWNHINIDTKLMTHLRSIVQKWWVTRVSHRVQECEWSITSTVSLSSWTSTKFYFMSDSLCSRHPNITELALQLSNGSSNLQKLCLTNTTFFLQLMTWRHSSVYLFIIESCTKHKQNIVYSTVHWSSCKTAAAYITTKNPRPASTSLTYLLVQNVVSSHRKHYAVTIVIIVSFTSKSLKPVEQGKTA